MPPYPKQPVVDAHNPCYCPSLPARAYIHNLHQNLARNTSLANLGFPPLHTQAANPFTKSLAQSVNTPGIEPGDKGVLDSDSDTSISTASTSSSSNSDSTSTTASDDASGSASDESQNASGSRLGSDLNKRLPSIPLARRELLTHRSFVDDTTDSDMQHNRVTRRFNGLRDSRLLARPPRKRKELHTENGDSDTDSDLRGPAKQAKSIAGSLERSFKVKLKRETLRYDVPSSRGDQVQVNMTITLAEDPTGSMLASPMDSYSWLVSPHIQVDEHPFSLTVATEEGSSDDLLDKVKEVAPMIRLPGSVKNAQTLAQYLGRNGLLTTALLSLLSSTNVQELVLGPSLQDHNGLNIGPPDLFRELHGHGAFKYLLRLSCDNVPVKDDNVIHLHGLPLQYLSLNEAGLSNAAVFVLVPLRNSLTRFSISGNPAINDDVIPALIIFKRLEVLVVEETYINMEGLRRFARAVQSENRKLRIEIPLHCRYYINHLHNQYLLHPLPPLLTTHDRETIWSLQLVDLRKNLAAHSVVNRSVLTTGNKAELRERLSLLLAMREKDLMVKGMYEDGLMIGVEPRMSFGLIGTGNGKREEEESEKESGSDNSSS